MNQYVYVSSPRMPESVCVCVLSAYASRGRPRVICQPRTYLVSCVIVSCVIVSSLSVYTYLPPVVTICTTFLSYSCLKVTRYICLKVHLLEGHTSTYFQLDPPWVPDIRSRSRTRLARVAHTSRHTSAPWGGAYHWFTAAIGCPPRLVGVPSTARSSSTISNCPPLSAASCRAWRAFAAPRGEMM